MDVRRTITVKTRQAQSLSARVTLVERLQRLSGVIAAVFDSNDTSLLAVTFRANSLSPLTLLDFLRRSGMQADLLTDTLTNTGPDSSRRVSAGPQA